MARKNIEDVILDECICCPHCQGKLILNKEVQNKYLCCSQCNARYEVLDNIPLFLSSNKVEDSATKLSIQEFWGTLYKTVYSSHDKECKKEEFLELLPKLESLFYHRQHLSVVEMPINEINGKKVLEIGSGAGAHSTFFGWLGAEMFSMDITLERVVATAKKIDFLETSKNICLQADAEQLPFPDEFFDVVFSNGVLHHTPETGKAIDEVYRVLKPGGKAVIMLYAKNSFYYWVILFFLKGIVSGNIFKSRNWLGKVTEWMSREPQKVFNPVTKVFTANEVCRLFSGFNTVKIRKSSFNVQQLPKIGSLLSKLLSKKTGLDEAGVFIVRESLA